MSGVLTCEAGLGNTDKVVRYINEARDMGVKVLPPDINLSGLTFTPEASGSIRFGLGAVKNVGANVVGAIMAARSEAGHFTSIFQFCEKTDLRVMNKRVLESLIKAGALDSLNPGQGQACRAALTAAVDKAYEGGSAAQRDRQSGQGGLFGAMFESTSAAEPAASLPKVPEWPEKDRLAGEKETIGFYLSG